MVQYIYLKLRSHGILYYLWSADLSKSFPQLIIFPVENSRVTPFCFYRDSLTLNSFKSTNLKSKYS